MSKPAPWFSATITQDTFHILCDASNIDRANYEPDFTRADIWPCGDLERMGDGMLPSASGYMGHKEIWFAKDLDGHLVVMWKKETDT